MKGVGLGWNINGDYLLWDFIFLKIETGFRRGSFVVVFFFVWRVDVGFGGVVVVIV